MKFITLGSNTITGVLMLSHAFFQIDVINSSMTNISYQVYIEMYFSLSLGTLGFLVLVACALQGRLRDLPAISFSENSWHIKTMKRAVISVWAAAIFAIVPFLSLLVIIHSDTDLVPDAVLPLDFILFFSCQCILLVLLFWRFYNYFGNQTITITLQKMVYVTRHHLWKHRERLYLGVFECFHVTPVDMVTQTSGLPSVYMHDLVDDVACLYLKTSKSHICVQHIYHDLKYIHEIVTLSYQFNRMIGIGKEENEK